MIDAYARKFGGPEAAGQIIERITGTAAEDGLEFRLDIAQRANTFDAHRVLAYAEGQHRQWDMKERLLRAYFVEGVNVGDRAELARLAGEVGLDADAVSAHLASDEGVADLREALMASLERGITAVPTFVVGGRWAVPGAQDPETMLIVLQKVEEKLAAS